MPLRLFGRRSSSSTTTSNTVGGSSSTSLVSSSSQSLGNSSSSSLSLSPPNKKKDTTTTVVTPKQLLFELLYPHYDNLNEIDTLYNQIQNLIELDKHIVHCIDEDGNTPLQIICSNPTLVSNIKLIKLIIDTSNLLSWENEGEINKSNASKKPPNKKRAGRKKNQTQSQQSVLDVDTVVQVPTPALAVRQVSVRTGNMALHIACRNGCGLAGNIASSPNTALATVDVIEYLIACHPSAICTPNTLLYNLPLHEACMSVNNNTIPFELILLLIQQYPDSVKTPNIDGNLPLHLAAHIQYKQNNKFTNNTNTNTSNILARISHSSTNKSEQQEIQQKQQRDMLYNTNNHFDIIQYITDYYPDGLLIRNYNGQTPIDIALLTTSGAYLSRSQQHPIVIFLQDYLEEYTIKKQQQQKLEEEAEAEEKEKQKQKELKEQQEKQKQKEQRLLVEQQKENYHNHHQQQQQQQTNNTIIEEKKIDNNNTNNVTKATTTKTTTTVAVKPALNFPSPSKFQFAHEPIVAGLSISSSSQIASPDVYTMSDEENNNSNSNATTTTNIDSYDNNIKKEEEIAVTTNTQEEIVTIQEEQEIVKEIDEEITKKEEENNETNDTTTSPMASKTIAITEPPTSVPYYSINNNNQNNNDEIINNNVLDTLASPINRRRTIQTRSIRRNRYEEYDNNNDDDDDDAAVGIDTIIDEQTLLLVERTERKKVSPWKKANGGSKNKLLSKRSLSSNVSDNTTANNNNEIHDEDDPMAAVLLLNESSSSLLVYDPSASLSSSRGFHHSSNTIATNSVSNIVEAVEENEEEVTVKDETVEQVRNEKKENGREKFDNNNNYNYKDYNEWIDVNNNNNANNDKPKNNLLVMEETNQAQHDTFTEYDTPAKIVNDEKEEDYLESTNPTNGSWKEATNTRIDFDDDDDDSIEHNTTVDVSNEIKDPYTNQQQNIIITSPRDQNEYNDQTTIEYDNEHYVSDNDANDHKEVHHHNNYDDHSDRSSFEPEHHDGMALNIGSRTTPGEEEIKYGNNDDTANNSNKGFGHEEYEDNSQQSPFVQSSHASTVTYTKNNEDQDNNVGDNCLYSNVQLRASSSRQLYDLDKSDSSDERISTGSKDYNVHTKRAFSAPVEVMTPTASSNNDEEEDEADNYYHHNNVGVKEHNSWKTREEVDPKELYLTTTESSNHIEECDFDQSAILNFYNRDNDQDSTSYDPNYHDSDTNLHESHDNYVTTNSYKTSNEKDYVDNHRSYQVTENGNRPIQQSANSFHREQEALEFRDSKEQRAFQEINNEPSEYEGYETKSRKYNRSEQKDDNVQAFGSKNRFKNDYETEDYGTPYASTGRKTIGNYRQSPWNEEDSNDRSNYKQSRNTNDYGTENDDVSNSIDRSKTQQFEDLNGTRDSDNESDETPQHLKNDNGPKAEDVPLWKIRQQQVVASLRRNIHNSDEEDTYEDRPKPVQTRKESSSSSRRSVRRFDDDSDEEDKSIRNRYNGNDSYRKSDHETLDREEEPIEPSWRMKQQEVVTRFQRQNSSEEEDEIEGSGGWRSREAGLKSDAVEEIPWRSKLDNRRSRFSGATNSQENYPKEDDFVSPDRKSRFREQSKPFDSKHESEQSRADQGHELVENVSSTPEIPWRSKLRTGNSSGTFRSSRFGDSKNHSDGSERNQVEDEIYNNSRQRNTLESEQNLRAARNENRSDFSLYNENSDDDDPLAAVRALEEAIGQDYDEYSRY